MLRGFASWATLDEKCQVYWSQPCAVNFFGKDPNALSLSTPGRKSDVGTQFFPTIVFSREETLSVTVVQTVTTSVSKTLLDP